MAFNRFTSVGSAQARVTVDLSPVQESVALMRSFAQQMGDSIRQISQNKIDFGKPTALPEFDSFINAQKAERQAAKQAAQEQQRLQREIAQAAKQSAQEHANAERQVTSEVQRQFQIAQSTVGEIRRQVAEQANLFRTATAGAPQTVSRTDAETQLRAARQPVVELQRQLGQLRTAYLQATSPEQRNALTPELQRITAEARNAANAMQPLRQSVSDFASQVQASRSGVTGYFNQVRENIERINETSLAANLQEISFRLLPLGAAAAALTARGVETAQAIQESTISFEAFTGSQETARTLMGELTQQAHRFGQPMIETLTTMQRFAPLIRQAGLELDDVYNLAVRLSTLNPAQGIEGALFAINEALAGQYRSLQTRFNIPTTQLRELIGEQGFVGGLDQFLNRLGRSTEFAERFGQTSRAAFTRLQDSINNFLSTSMEHFLDGMSEAANTATDFFNTLAEGAPFITQLTGGLLTIVSSGSAALITLGQMALAITSLRAVIGPLNLGGFIASTLPSGIVSAFTSAMPAITNLLQGGITLAVRAGLLAGTVAAGAFVGVRAAAVLGVGGTHDVGEQQNRLNQILFVAIAKIAEPFYIGANVIGAAINNLGAVLDLAGTIISGSVANIGIAITQAIQGIEIGGQRPFAEFGGGAAGIAQAQQATQSRFVISGGGKEIVISAPSLQEGDPLIQRALEHFQEQYAGATVNFVEGFNERIIRQTNTLGGGNFQNLIDQGIQQARDALLALLGVEGTAVPGGGLGAGGARGIDPEQLQEALKLSQEIAEAQRQFMLEQKRMLDDRALAAEREAEDFSIGQRRSLDNFRVQQSQALEDYNRSRMQSIEDFERQLAESEAESHEQRAKQQEDFQKQMLRAEQDHQREMIRMARDIDRAISARNFLEAQNRIQDMQDAQEDFDVEQGRRHEDFNQQIAELDENLKKQQDKRREDFARQLERQEENFKLQQQRQIANFDRQRALEEQDRQRRLARQAQDYAIQDQRRYEDFQQRISDMITHSEAIQSIWKQGLDTLQFYTEYFFNGLPPMIQDILSTFTGGSAGTPYQPGAANAGNNYNYYGAPGGGLFSGVISSSGSLFGLPSVTGYQPGSGMGFQPGFQEGSWFVPRTMNARVHQGEIITPEPFASAVRRGEATIGGGNGSVSISIPLQVINGQGLDEERVAQKAAAIIVPQITEAIKEKNRQNQSRRGWD